MKKILFYSPDFSMCYSMLMYLQDKYIVTSTTDLDIVKSLSDSSGFDVVLMDTEPSGEVEEICKMIREKNCRVPVILTYVYQSHIKDYDKSIRQYVNSIFYKPFDLNEVSAKLSALSV